MAMRFYGQSISAEPMEMFATAKSAVEKPPPIIEERRMPAKKRATKTTGFTAPDLQQVDARARLGSTTSHNRQPAQSRRK